MTLPPDAHTSRNAGFTLIEMLMVVTMLAVITSIVSPSFRMSPSRRVENTAYLVASHLELARSNALAQRRTVRVDFDAVNATLTAYADHDGDDSIAGVAAELDAFPEFRMRSLDSPVVAFGRGSAPALPGDTASGAVTFLNDRLTLDRLAIPTPWGSTGTIYLVNTRDPTAVSAIAVAASGGFKVWRWSQSEGQWR